MLMSMPVKIDFLVVGLSPTPIERWDALHQAPNFLSKTLSSYLKVVTAQASGPRLTQENQIKISLDSDSGVTTESGTPSVRVK